MAKSWYQSTGIQSDHKWGDNSDIFGKKRKKKQHTWGVANRMTFDPSREKKDYREGPCKMVEIDTKRQELDFQRELAKIDGWDFA